MDAQPYVCQICRHYPCSCGRCEPSSQVPSHVPSDPLEAAKLVCPYCGCDDLDVANEPTGLFKCQTCGGEFV